MPRTAVTSPIRKSNLNDPYSVYFNGTSAKMTVPVVPNPTGWCLAMWIKPGDKGTPTHTYVSYNSAAFTDGIFISKNANSANININVYNGGTSVYANTLNAPASQWIHIAVTYLPNGTCKTYKNGVLLSSATSSGTMTAAAAQLLTFNSRSFTNYFAQSTISNIVWQNTTTSWTDAQVLDLYQSDTVPAGVTMYLAMNEGTGTTATDTSGNGNNGTLTAPTWTTDTPTKLRTANTFPQRKTPDNLLSNGNFEYAPPFTAATTTALRWINGTSGGSNNTESPYGWWLPSSFVASASAQYDTSVYRSGTASLKLSTLDATGVANALSGSNFNKQAVEETAMRVLPNTTYTLTGWAKTNNVKTNSVYMDALEYVGSIATTTITATNKLSGTNDWTQLTTTFTTNSNTRYLFIVLRNAVAGNVSDAWFDDITLTKTYPVKSTRSLVDNTIIYNSNFEYVPTGTTATTSGSAWIDGTATGVTNKGEFGWVIFNYTGSWAAKFDTTEKASGTASMKISTTAVSSTIGVSNQEGTALSNQINNMPIAPNTSYTLSFKMKTLVNSGSATTGAYLSVIGYKVDGFSGASSFTGTTSSTRVNTTTGWTDYSITFTTASTAYYLRPELRIIGNDGTGTLIMDAWFDDITLVKN